MAIITNLSKSVVLSPRIRELYREIRLFTAPAVINPDLDLDDLDIATFSGYRHELLTWGGVSFDAQGRAFVVANPIQWDHNGGNMANTIRGWCVLDEEGNVHALGLLNAPKTMAASGDRLTLILTLDLGQR